MSDESESPRAVLLCAGASSRLGEPKALATIGGRSVLERLIEAVAGVDTRPLVVTGKDHGALEPEALRLGADVVLNAGWEHGRTGSVAAGARARSGSDLVLVPADVPLVAPGTLDALVESWLGAGSPPHGWLAPRIELPDGRVAFGHPVVIGRELCARDLPALPPDVGLKALRGLAEPLLSAAVDDHAILDDLDTPEDLAALRARVGG